MQAQLKAAKEQQKAERQAQQDAARLLAEQAKAARAEAKAARDAEKAAATQLAAAAKEVRERERAEKTSLSSRDSEEARLAQDVLKPEPHLTDPETFGHCIRNLDSKYYLIGFPCAASPHP